LSKQDVRVHGGRFTRSGIGFSPVARDCQRNRSRSSRGSAGSGRHRRSGPVVAGTSRRSRGHGAARPPGNRTALQLAARRRKAARALPADAGTGAAGGSRGRSKMSGVLDGVETSFSISSRPDVSGTCPILSLHQHFATPETHGGTRSYEMPPRLVERRHAVAMITAWPEDDGRRGWFHTHEAGIEVHWIPVPYSNHLSYSDRLRAFFRFAQKAAVKAAAIPADLVFATSTPLTIALPAVYAARRQRIPMVFEVRDLWPTMPIVVGALRNPGAIAAARWLERFAYRNSERVVALSPGMRDGIVEAGYDAAKISVIPNSCDNDLFSSVSRTDARAGLRQRHPELAGGPLVGYTGTMGHINAVEYLVEMAAAARERGSKVRFAVFGEGAEEKAVVALAQDRGVLGHNFWIYEPLPKKDMPRVIRSLDLATSLFKNIP